MSLQGDATCQAGAGLIQSRVDGIAQGWKVRTPGLESSSQARSAQSLSLAGVLSFLTVKRRSWLRHHKDPSYFSAL